MKRVAALVAAVSVAAGLFSPAAEAGAAECSRYGLRGILPGMPAREVWRLMDGKGRFQQVMAGPGAGAGLVVYDRRPPVLVVEYDGEPRDPTTRVKLVRVTLGPAPGEIDPAVAPFLASLGPPDIGARRLEAGLKEGPAVWIAEACDLAVVAYRQVPPWWEPQSAAMVLQVESLVSATRKGAPGRDAVLGWQASRPPRSFAISEANPPIATKGDEAVAAPVRGESSPPAPIPSPRETSASRPGVRPEGDPGASPAAGDISLVGSQEASSADVGPAPVPPSEQDRLTDPVRIPGTGVPPRYPPLLRSRKITGRVELRATVGADGAVRQVEVVEVTPPEPLFADAAIEAVRSWRYEPARREGVPVEGLVTVILRFE